MSEILQKYRFLSKLLPDISQKKLVLLTGARQTGKTTLARHCYPDLNYINLDSPENRDLLKEMHSDVWGKNIGHAILDEAQKEPVVFDKIKYAFDGGQVSFQVLLGSSHILLMKKIRESLAGRVSLYELFPLMLSEHYWQSDDEIVFPLLHDIFTSDSFYNLFGKVPDILFGEDAIRRKSIETYQLAWGGMPALLCLNDDEKRKWLKDYEFTYLERDLADLARLDDLTPFRKFQQLSALRSGCLLNYSELGRDAGLSVDTAKRYLEYLQISYQTITLQPFYQNLTSSLVKTHKLYWLDIGLLRQLTGQWGPVTGLMFETYVVSEIIKWIRTMGLQAEPFFYRTRSGLELDMLVRTQNGYIGIEIKNREKIVKSDLTAMKKVATSLGADWLGGLVVYRGNSIVDLKEMNIFAMPSWRLLT